MIKQMDCPLVWVSHFLIVWKFNQSYCLSIPAIKGIEFGNGFAATRLFGSQNNDAIIDESGRTKLIMQAV